MNLTKIDYVDYTWNPVTGCTKGCEYCYAARLAQGRLRKTYNVVPGATEGENIISPEYLNPDGYGGNPAQPFAPRYWHSRILEPLKFKKSQRIFVCNMGDLFDPYVPDNWINLVINTARMCRQHTFLFLTKQPARMAQFEFPDNCWCGITLENHDTLMLKRLMSFRYVKAPVKFISYEPLLGRIFAVPPPNITYRIDWIIVGAMTGKNAIKPETKWIQEIITQVDRLKIPLFLKDNLNWKDRRRELPEGGEK